MDYKFTEDWFSENNPEKVVNQFEGLLSEFKGKLGLGIERDTSFKSTPLEECRSL